jgi:sterol desaturase/sphingolipid hydroxylase (fatty acid hydroxylase superfamily)
MAVVFGLAEYFSPLGPRLSFFPSSWSVDLSYLVVTILCFSQMKRLIGYFLSVIPLVDAFGLGSKIAVFPFWLQVVGAFLLADGLSYWQHRFFHRRPLWTFHAIHHSAPRLDWLSSFRFHPVDILLKRVTLSLPLALLGFSPLVIAAFLPVAIFFSFLTHARVPWTFGPLRYLIVSPAFHRWHHAQAPEAAGKNLGGILAVWDFCFGTFYMPENRSLEFSLGTAEVIPENIWQQTIYPFSRHGKQ